MAYVPPPPTLFQRILRITLWTVVGGSLVAFFIPAILPYRAISRRPMEEKTVCASNLMGIGRAFHLYADDNGGAYPDTSSTQPATTPPVER